MQRTKLLCCRSILVLLFFFIIFPLYSQQDRETSPFSLGIIPQMQIPLGEDRDIFDLSGGTEIAGRFQFPLTDMLDLAMLMDLEYQYTPVKADTSISTLTTCAGAGLNWNISRWFLIGAFVKGGYFYSLLNDTSDLPVWVEQTGGGNVCISEGLTTEFRILPGFSLGLTAAYRSNLGFSRSIAVSLSGYYHFPKRTAVQQGLPYGELLISDQQLDSLFPVFYTYYDDHPIGKALLTNTGSAPMEDIRATIYVEQYMANPKPCGVPVRLGPGQNGELIFYGLFSDDLLGITESTKVSARISVECMVGKKLHRNEYSETIRLHDRNAMSWDDDRKAAAFVTMKDPAVLSFSRVVASAAREQRIPLLGNNLVTALAMHQALRQYGISYVVDPNTPYTVFSQETGSVDYLQFPRQTLEYSTGDCDDLSILYCALLEAVGINTAFITVPGHIYTAFSLGMSPNEARSRFEGTDDFIFLQGDTWLPLEAMEIEGGFLAAWDAGATQWQEHQSAGEARLYPLAAAWKIYPPVGLPGEPAYIPLPEKEELIAAVQDEVGRLVRREIAPRAELLKSRMESSGEEPETGNKLGVLYARYGLLDEAEEVFRDVLKDRDYGPALLNMGNLCYLQGRYREAMNNLERAESLMPENPRVLMALARVQHALEEYSQAKMTFSRLQEMAPDLASKISFISRAAEDSTRSAEAASIKETIVWEE